MSEAKAKTIEWVLTIIGLLSMFSSGYLLAKNPTNSFVISFVLLIIGVLFVMVEVEYEKKGPTE